jgi:Effector-associated domain 7
MDPLSMIVTALVAGASAALKDTAVQAIKDAYSGLKGLISRKFASEVFLGAALTLAEKKPDDKSRQELLQDELKSAKADEDSEVLKQAQALLELIKQNEPALAAQYTATLTGSGAIAQGPNTRAVGAGGVMVEGDVQGTINTGTQSTVNTGGGAYIGGSVHTPGTFVGRDQTVNNYYTPPVTAAAGLAATPEGRKLGGLLDSYFSLGDIEGLCFEMGIDDENLRGQTKIERARALILFCEKNNRLDELKKLMRVQRPNLRDQLRQENE